MARVLLVVGDSVLLLQAHEGEARWWVTPGGGVERGETFEQAAVREVKEETGFSILLGPWVWTRRHQYRIGGQAFDQYERFFVARPIGEASVPARPDGYVIGSRWWSVGAIASSAAEDFAPRRLPTLLVDIVARRYPESPIDCGV